MQLKMDGLTLLDWTKYGKIWNMENWMEKHGIWKIGLIILDKMDGTHGLNMIETIMKEGVMVYDTGLSFS